MSDEEYIKEILKKIEEKIENLRVEIKGMSARIDSLEDKIEGKAGRERLTTAQRKILEDLNKSDIKVFTVYDISKRYNITYTGAYKFVKALEKAGVIKGKEPGPGEGRKKEYTVNNQTDEE